MEMLRKNYSAAPAVSVAAHSSCPQLHAIEGCSADPSQYAPQYLLPSAGGQLQPGCAHLSLWFSIMMHLPALQIPLPGTGHNGFGVPRSTLRAAILSFLFRRLRDGDSFNRQYNSLIVGSYDLQQFGHMAFSISVVYKRSECYECASFGVSLYHPMKDQ